MNKQNVLIFKLAELYEILNELKNYLDFEIYSFSEEKKLLNLIHIFIDKSIYSVFKCLN